MSYQIEQAAIASLLYGGWNFGGHELTEDDFLDGQHRQVFRAVQELQRAGQDADIFSVAAKLDFDIDHLADIPVGAKRIRGYVDALKDESLKRAVHSVCRASLAGEGTGREQLLHAQSLLASLEGKLGGDALPIGDHVDAWWAELGNRESGGNWLRTNYPDVDNRTGGMRGGDLVILAGRPAMGKTALALNISVKCRSKVAFFSLEMQAEGLLDRMAASLAQVPLSKIRSGKLSQEEWSRVSEASAKIRGLPIHLDQQAGLTIEEIHARSRAIKACDGLNLVVVDYLQLIAATDRRQGQYERITHISQMAKRMAKDLDVPVIMLAQLSRKCEERGSDKRPMPSDLRDSGSIEQDADVIAFVYRDEVYDEHSAHKGYAELIFRKVRQGMTGTDWFLFDGPHQTFKQTTKPAQEARVMVAPYGIEQ